MRILVTGGTGFTGCRVVARLVAQGHDVTALARSARAMQRIVDLGASPLPGDLDDPRSLDGAFAAARADALANIASLGFGHAPAIISAAQEAGMTRAVFVSTTAIFTDVPAPSKTVRLEAEDLIQSSGMEWSILRPTMIYGAPGDRNMARLLGVLRRVPVFPLPGGGSGLQQPVHVDDMADAIVAALAPHAVGKAYDVAGPEPLTFRDIVLQAAHAVRRSPRLFSVPLPPLIMLMSGYQRVTQTPRLKAEQLARLAEDKAFDISAAQRDLGHCPRSFLEGITAEAAMLP